MAETKKFLTEGKSAPKFKTADQYVPAPKGVPHSHSHARNYTPSVPAPKNR